MTLTPGTRLGPYEVLARVGAGGMGEVYRARDARLDRIVAIKTIASDLDGVRERFEREARTISALQHPHICVLHDVGEDGGVRFLVMEYLEGETLADRLQSGPLPLRDVLQHAIEIVSALRAAHDRGVIHRDLKPANVMLTASGAKLLDFGLARLVPTRTTGDDDGLLATREQSLTREGTLLGTFQYMAPEQLEGRAVDARTDLFAFGALVYEMATGRKAFEGRSQASLIAKILESAPPSLSTANPATPPALDHLVRVCLAKDPADRWQTARDVLTQLEWIADERAALPLPASGRRAFDWRVGGLAAALVASLAALAVVSLRPDAPGGAPSTPASAGSASARMMPAGRFEVTLPPDVPAVAPVLAPDARRVVLATTRNDLRRPLWVRALDSSALLPLPGTEGAQMPFWSADGASIGFFVDGKLKRIAATSGAIVALADAPNPGGGAWAASGDIVYASNGVIHRVAESGGKSEAITALDRVSGEVAHSFPQFIPGQRRFVYLVSGERPGVYATSIGTKERTTLSRILRLTLSVFI